MIKAAIQFLSFFRKSQSRRTLLLSVIFVGVGFSFCRALTVSPSSQFQRSQSTSAIKPTLNAWELKSEEPLAIAAKESRYDQITMGTRYIYQRDQQRLTIELREVQATSGDIGLLYAKYLPASSPPQFQPIRLKNGSAYFLAEKTQQGLQQNLQQNLQQSLQQSLQTCINFNGRASTTRNEFYQNAYQQALNPSRLLTWLMGQHPLIENRCLWVRITTQTSDPSQITEMTKVFEALSGIGD
jgi:cyanosortase A-associated protein